MNWSEIDLCKEPSLHAEAAALLMDTFLAIGNTAWPKLESARQALDECIADPNLCLGMLIDDWLAGWVGLRPMYDKTWELHPLVVAPARQGQGVGKALMRALEQRAKAKGLIRIVLGTDDELFETSLSQTDINAIYPPTRWRSHINLHVLQPELPWFYLHCDSSITPSLP
jgi:aminoglycoside 6'-N-acetyltransferase I